MNLRSSKTVYNAQSTLDIIKSFKTAGLNAGVTGTPAFFVNGRKFDEAIMTTKRVAMEGARDKEDLVNDQESSRNPGLGTLTRFCLALAVGLATHHEVRMQILSATSDGTGTQRHKVDQGKVEFAST